MTAEKKPPLTLAEIAAALRPFAEALSEQQLAAIQKYIQLLLLWNEKVSLTSVHSPLDIVQRHFGESIFAGKYIDLSRGRLADVGTGAGFPGLALKIAFPELEVVLIEPNSKKCAFLKEVSSQLGLARVEVVRSGYADLPATAGKFDYICSRALGGYQELLSWCRGALEPTGAVILWVGEEDSAKIGRLPGWRWGPSVAIPGSQRRVILVGKPISPQERP